MRSRLPLVLIALTIFFAFVAAGCGDDKTGTVEAVPDGTTQSTGAGSTGSNGSATASAKKVLDNCLKAAENISDADRSAEVKKGCQDSYNNIAESSAKIDQATSDARAQCEEAAGNITNAQAKSAALSACAKFK